VDDLEKKGKKENCAKLLNAQVVDAPEFFSGFDISCQI
jgi:hypothetical protein